MSRHGYSDDHEDGRLACWRGVIASATRGKRGQAFFRALVAALDAMPDKRLVKGDLETAEGSVCALGCLGKARGDELGNVDTYDWDALGGLFDIAPQLAQEVMFINDDWSPNGTEQNRWKLVRDWAARQIRCAPEELVGVDTGTEAKVTQSANARPCNCDQALKAERDLQRCLDHGDAQCEAWLEMRDERDQQAARADAFELTCAAQGQKLTAIERILCDLVSAPSLSVAQFADPTLERVRLAMLGRER